MKLRVQSRFQRDARGMRARVGDLVLFQLDPEKDNKRASEGIVTRWIAPRVVEVRYVGTAYDGTKGPHYFDLTSSEFIVARQGKLSERVEARVNARLSTQEARW